MKKNILDSFENFWRLNPALLYGLSMLIGMSLYLTNALILALPIFLIVLAKKRAPAAILILMSSYFFIFSVSPFFECSENGQKGMAHFTISSISLKNSLFAKQWIYKGRVKMEGFNQAINVSISIPFKKEILRPPANRSYYIEGTLKEVSKRQYIFTLDKNIPWKEIASSWSFAEYRYRLKQNIQNIIRKKIKHEESSKFLSGIATGEFDDRLMSFHFSRFGLQHIMSISGFHFAILSTILHAIIRCFLHRKSADLTMMFLLTVYFIFLGMAPSILRAYVMILIVFLGSSLKKTPIATNSLGVALIIVLLVDPLLIDHIGFQFSFAVTLSILLLYSEIQIFLQNLLPQRFLGDITEMNNLHQHGFLILNTLRQAIALCIAVNLAALPLMLYHFEQFPILSILYNFFFPFMVSFSMLLLIVGLIFPFLPLIDSLNTTFTKFLLDFAYNMPQTIDIKFFYKGLSLEPLILYFTLLFFIGIQRQLRREKMAEERRDFAYM